MGVTSLLGILLMVYTQKAYLLPLIFKGIIKRMKNMVFVKERVKIRILFCNFIKRSNE